jgi:hypothetical protein
LEFGKSGRLMAGMTLKGWQLVAADRVRAKDKTRRGMYQNSAPCLILDRGAAAFSVIGLAGKIRGAARQWRDSLRLQTFSPMENALPTKFPIP